MLQSTVSSWISPLTELPSHNQWVIRNGRLIQTPQTPKLVYQTNGKVLSLVLPKGYTNEDPIYLVHLIEEPIHYKTQLIVEEEANAKIIECYFQDIQADPHDTQEPFCVNTKTEILLKKAAVLDHTLWISSSSQPSSVDTAIFTDTQVEQSEKSRYRGFLTVFDCMQHRSTMCLSLKGQQAETEIYALFLPKQTETASFNCLVQHLQPDCRSHMMVRSVVDDYGKFDFSGKIKVNEGASQSVARLENKNILLSSRAQVHTNPELEIYHDNLQCSHGAAIGCLDRDALFYLKSRGIPEQEARQMMIHGFIQPVLQAVQPPALQTYLERHLNEPA